MEGQRLARDAASDAIKRHGGELNAALLTPHVIGAITIDDVDAERPLVSVVDPETGKPRPGVSVDARCASCRCPRISAPSLENPPQKDSGMSRSRHLLPSTPGSPAITTMQPSRHGSYEAIPV